MTTNVQNQNNPFVLLFVGSGHAFIYLAYFPLKQLPCAATEWPKGNGKKLSNKQQLGTAGAGNMLGCCLVSFHFLWAILCPQTVKVRPLSGAILNWMVNH